MFGIEREKERLVRIRLKFLYLELNVEGTSFHRKKKEAASRFSLLRLEATRCSDVVPWNAVLCALVRILHISPRNRDENKKHSVMCVLYLLWSKKEKKKELRGVCVVFVVVRLCSVTQGHEEKGTRRRVQEKATFLEDGSFVARGGGVRRLSAPCHSFCRGGFSSFRPRMRSNCRVCCSALGSCLSYSSSGQADVSL